MKIKVGQIYEGKVSGEFKLESIKKVNGEIVFIISTVNHSNIQLTLDEMREEKQKEI
jgi:hypothetical protein